MKKVLKRLLVLTLVSMFALGSAGAFAANDSYFTTELGKKDNISTIVDKESKKESKKTQSVKQVNNAKSAKAINTINAKYLAYSTDKKYNYYGGTITQQGEVLPITVKATETGKLYFDTLASKGKNGVIVRVCKTMSINNGLVDYTYTNSVYVNPKQTKIGSGGIDVVKGRSYYFVIESQYSSDKNYNETAGISAYIYSYTTGRTLPVNKIMLASGRKGSSSSSLLYKVKPSKTGYIKVDLKSYSSSYNYGYITLYNSKKKAISSKLWYDGNYSRSKVYFGVKAKTTYYIKVNGSNSYYNSAGQYRYGIKYANAGVKDYNLSKKSKAKTIKRKKAVSTVFVASTGKSVDWYKFKVTKKRKTQIKVYTSGIKSGKVGVTIYKGKKKVNKATIPASYNGLSLTSIGSLPKGTYYIKVQQGAKCSGKYSIKYVK